MISILFNLIIGWLAAIAVNYLADVLPIERKFVSPRCKDCGERISWRYYFFLEACQSCEERPSFRHHLVYIIGPVLGLALHFFPISNLGNFGGLIWLLYFGLVVVIDLEHRLILHPVSLVGAALAAFFGSLNHGILNTLLGGAAGFGIMLLFYYLGEIFVKVMAKSRGEKIDEVALGFGDVNLAGIMGLLLGWPGVIGGLALAIILGGIASGIYLVVQSIRKKYQAFSALPYGPFLVLSIVILFYLSQSY
jgi:leader peptidase (prepilin peptidase)/N-methyltransferase